MSTLVKFDGGDGKVVGQACACAFSMQGCIYDTFFSLGPSIGVQGKWEKRIVNSGSLIYHLHLPLSPASFAVYCDPSEVKDLATDGPESADGSFQMSY